MHGKSAYLQQRAVVSDDGGLTNHHACSMVQQDALACNTQNRVSMTNSTSGRLVQVGSSEGNSMTSP